MLHAIAREDRKLLSLDERHHAIDYRNTCLYEVPWILARCRIHRHAIDVSLILRRRNLSPIARLAKSIHDTAKHLFRDTKSKRLSEEVHFRIWKIQTVCALKALHAYSIIRCIKNLS